VNTKSFCSIRPRTGNAFKNRIQSHYFQAMIQILQRPLK